VIVPDPELRRFAWRIAGPRDFAINFAVNGLIAWWVFGSSDPVPLAGTESIFKMLLPMSALESAITSYFGLMNGDRLLRQKEKSRREFRLTSRVAGYCLIQAACGFGAFVLAMFAARQWLPDATVGGREVPLIVGTLSGILAFALHSRAVLKAETL
jgi:hypothetical protein